MPVLQLRNLLPTKPRGLCTGMCVLSVSQKVGKVSNTLRLIVETSKSQKPSKLGCRYAISLLLSSQTCLVTNQNSKYTKQELLANKCTALSWFRSFEVFDNRCDGRLYAQVLSAHPISQSLSHPQDGNNSTPIVAIP